MRFFTIAHPCDVFQRILDKLSCFLHRRVSEQAVLPSKRRDEDLAMVQQLVWMVCIRSQIFTQKVDVLSSVSWDRPAL